MKIITLEEHFLDPDVSRASASEAARLSPGFHASFDPARGLPYSPTFDVLTDLGDGRIAAMDAGGIAVQVVSSLTTQQLSADVAPGLVRAVNDRLAAAVRAHPDRFAGFAALPTADPQASVDELARCVGELGFVGTLIHGRTGGEYLDAPPFEPILAKAAELKVPVYLHPGIPPREVSDASYGRGLDELVVARFQTAAWGWHAETGVHFLHLVLSGVFDRHPTLQVILGHWGEMVPFWIDRLDEALPTAVTGLDRPIGAYLRENAYVTPSGMWSQGQLQLCVEAVGVDRIMFSVDYPFIDNDGAAGFLDAANLSEDAKEKFAHGTAERLLGI